MLSPRRQNGRVFRSYPGGPPALISSIDKLPSGKLQLSTALYLTQNGIFLGRISRLSILFFVGSCFIKPRDVGRCRASMNPLSTLPVFPLANCCDRINHLSEACEWPEPAVKSGRRESCALSLVL